MQVDIKDFLRHYAGKHWVVALSGGADSRLLLELVAQERALATQVEAVYVHHHLQEVADAWADFCRAECQKLALKFTVEHVEVSSVGSVEACAREARYAALARHVGANSVLFTAHHADDLLESMLLALMRGSGLDGMSALPCERAFGLGLLARPLLPFSRLQIEQSCAQLGLKFVTDPTNNEIEYDRNFMRHEIVPLLKERFPQVLKSAVASARSLGASKMVYAQLLSEKLKLLKIKCHALEGLSLVKLKELSLGYANPIELQRELVRAYLKTEFGLVLNASKVSELLSFMELSSDNHASILSDGLRVFVYAGGLFVLPDVEVLRNLEIKLAIGASYEVALFKISLNLAPLEPTLASASTQPHNNISVSRLKAGSDKVEFNHDFTVMSYFEVPYAVEQLTLLFTPSLSTRLQPTIRAHSQFLKNLWKEYKVPSLMRPLFPLVLGPGGQETAQHLTNSFPLIPVALAGIFNCKSQELKKEPKLKRVVLTIEKLQS